MRKSFTPGHRKAALFGSVSSMALGVAFAAGVAMTPNAALAACSPANSPGYNNGIFNTSDNTVACSGSGFDDVIILNAGSDTLTITGGVYNGKDGDGFAIIGDGDTSGKDTVTINSDSGNPAIVKGSIDLGGQDDTFNLGTNGLGNSPAVQGSIYGSQGNDTFNLSFGTVGQPNSNKSVVGGSDDDTFNLDGATIYGNVYGDGWDVDVDFDYDKGKGGGGKGGGGGTGNITGIDDIDLDTVSGKDEGKDTFNLNGSTVTGSLFGNGNTDTFNLTKGTVGGDVDGGTGDDIIKLGTVSSVEGDDLIIGGDVIGGLGNDKIYAAFGVVEGDILGDEFGIDAGKGGGKGGGGKGGGDDFDLDDTIELTGTWVKGSVYGNEGQDTITLDGSVVDGNIYGDDKNTENKFNNADIINLYNGSVTSVYGGDDDDQILVKPGNPLGTLEIKGGIYGGDDDDVVTFDGANNVFLANLLFNPGNAVDGGSDYDTLNVTNGSLLSLGNIDDFENLNVTNGSALEITQRWSNFYWNGNRDGVVHVDGSSYLKLSHRRADLDTERFVLDAWDGISPTYAIYTGADAGYLYAPGGVLDVSGDSSGTADKRVEIVNSYWNGAYGRFVNNGTITLHNDYNDVTGDHFTINGDYEGQGNLLLDTFVYNAGSSTDILEINGDVISGSLTTIYVNNTNSGPGTFTGLGPDDGIRIVDTDGASPTDAFQLAVNASSGARELLVGAYSYRLYQEPVDDDYDGDWYLRSNLIESAPGYATVSSAAQRHFYAGVDSIYKRIGELRNQDALEGRNADLATKAPVYVPAPAPKWQLWGRGGGSDLSYEVDKGWDFDQTTYGFQIGGDYTFDYNSTRWSVGAFGGYGWSDADVFGDYSSLYSLSKLDIDGWNAGLYASVRQTGLVPGAGFYGDFVVKADVLDVDISSDRVDIIGPAITASTDATVWGASAEIGYGFSFGNGFVIQPQAQLTYASVSQDSYYDSVGTYVSPDDADSLIGRFGVQIQTTIAGVNGQSFTPWAVFNVLSEFLGDNNTNVAGTILTSDIGGTWYNAGAGFTAALTENVALYGSGEYNFGDVEGWAGTAGLKVRW